MGYGPTDKASYRDAWTAGRILKPASNRTFRIPVIVSMYARVKKALKWLESREQSPIVDGFVQMPDEEIDGGGVRWLGGVG